MLAYDYYNSALLRIREYRNGVDKLDRIDIETKKDHNKRRADYILFTKIHKLRRKNIKKVG